jgi:mono/diheme cytochrome c family protein
MRLKTVVIGILGILTLWGCDYARMNDQESVKTFERKMPEMPEGVIPVQGGLHALSEMDTEALVNPLPYDQASLEQGKKAYEYFCIMCHGPRGLGNGTVGQSFYPLPTLLVDSYVQDQTDGELFYTITFGMNRMPPMYFTATENYRWAVIHHMRALASETEQQALKQQ